MAMADPHPDGEVAVLSKIHAKSLKRKYLKRAKQLQKQVEKPVGSVGPFSRQNMPIESQDGGLERSSLDPTVTGLGLLVQKVTPTVRNGLSSNPVTSGSKKHSNDPTSDHERRSVLNSNCDQEDEPLNSSQDYGNTTLLFVEGCSQRLCSTPIADVASENSATQHCSRFSELEGQLQKQLDVNRELKRLLVASIGSDLQYRLNQIAEEKATISLSLDASLHKLAENHEEIDRVSIECDIWRSKFLASRLMVDELAGWKAEVTRQLKESQRALQCMLMESTELSGALLQCNHHLEGIVAHLGLKGRSVELGSDCGLKHGSSALEIARTNCSAAKVLRKQLGLSGETEESVRRIHHEALKATSGETMARKVLKSGHKAIAGEKIPNLPSPLRLHEVQLWPRITSPTHQASAQQYPLESRTTDTVIHCNRCRGEIHSV